MTSTVLLGLLFPLLASGQQQDRDWQEDFRYQPVATRPALEVNYTDASRTAFQILAKDYRLKGELERPHRLLDESGRPWLWMELEAADGQIYSTQFSRQASRINLYRRGPYFCEVHWFDLQPATADGRKSPLKGDLALYCYPEKILAEITWHGTDEFAACKLLVRGIAPKQFACAPFAAGSRQAFAFPLCGEEAPLPDEAFQLLEGETPVRYDARKGCYVVGTVTSNSFQRQFYEMPNRYETAKFRLRNDDRPRKIYLCHESVVGGSIVEGGIVLDEDGHPLPLLVQVSKNFAGEKEERFYNPHDTPFSETYFPLYLDPGEQTTLTSLHLYQNWGRHMTKHWSSLGAWMDYFHSSTGVTETTCYVPFKFGGIGGVAIADFRAMSQETFWEGQPQHDNLAGHSFLSFHDGQQWQHTKYESTVYRSTGPNWYDIRLNYTSADGSIRVAADIWETPQADELRSFFNVKYEVLKPLVIHDAQTRFRLLSLTSAIQNLRFTRLAASGMDEREIDFSQSPFPVQGHPLPRDNAWLAIFGDHVRNRGSNAVVLRNFTGPRGIGPAVSLQTGSFENRSQRDGRDDTRLLLVPDVETLELQPGDIFQIDAFWLPYGSRDDTLAPRREVVRYAKDMPQVTSCKTGTVLSHLPVRIRACENVAEFSLQGGKDLLPVLITGLTDWRYPRIWRLKNERWHLLSHARNTDRDGYQVFCEADGTYGAVFLVASNQAEQTLRVSAGHAAPEGEKIAISVESPADAQRSIPAVALADAASDTKLRIAFPEPHVASASTPSTEVPWNRSEGDSLWFEAREDGWRRGGRLTPNQDDLDLEYWWQNDREAMEHQSPAFIIDLKATPFADPAGERTWFLTSEGWRRFQANAPPAEDGTVAIAVTSADGNRIVCMAWRKASGVVADGGNAIGVKLQPLRFPTNRRYHIRGKIYLLDGDLEILRARIARDVD